MWSFGIRVTQRCGADRPAFVLEDSNRRFWFYAACGMLTHQSPCHQTLRGICKSVHAAASLLQAATSSMDGLVLRTDMVRSDPDMPKAATAHAKLLLALNQIGVKIMPPKQHEDVVALCRQHRKSKQRSPH